MDEPLLVHPLPRPVDGTVHVPGSKSLTARALVVAALAKGRSSLTGALDSDDTRRMAEALGRLGVPIAADWERREVVVDGCGGVPPGPERPGDEIVLDAGLAGTVARFVTPIAALVDGPVVVDGTTRMRERPMGDLLYALRRLGAEIEELAQPGHLPVRTHGGLTGGEVEVAGNMSSQFLSGLLLAAPVMPQGLRVLLSSPLVSGPYVKLTTSVMEAFGARIDRFDVPAGMGYQATEFSVEPDASAASYVFAAAAITGSRLRVDGLGRRSWQGDVGFVDLLSRMGALVEVSHDTIVVLGGPPLDGIEVDMSDTSDVAQTLAAVAVFANAPTRITGIGFTRRKETDRIAATSTELGRCGIRAWEEPDGIVIEPGSPHAAVIDTWGDHRVAMSMALLGLRSEGIRINDPAVTAKTFPGYFSMLRSLHQLPELRH